MSGTSRTARLGKEVVGYLLSPPSSVSQKHAVSAASSHAAIVPLNNPNPSAPLASLRGATPGPSASSWSVVVSQDGTSVLLVHADRERPLIHVHTYQAGANAAGASTSTQPCTLAARLHPPEPTPTLALSPRGTLLAAGSASGRLYIWHLASGHLLASVDAHFRSVSCLAWTACERGLVSGSDDARILVWSLEALVDSADRVHEQGTAGSMDTPMPFAVLADHVQGITSLALSSSSRAAIASFPSSMRIMSSSQDGTVKLWDVRTRNLVATWAFSGPVHHLAVDVGFRSFFAAVTARREAEADESQGPDQMEQDDTTGSGDDRQQYDWVRKVDLFDPHAQDNPNAGGSAATLMRVHGESTLVYQANAGTRITAMAMSLHGSHLLVGTSDTEMVTIDVASSVALRTTSLVAAGQTGTGKAGSGARVEVASLTTFLIDDPASLLQGASVKGKGGHGTREPGWPVAEKLQRAVQRHDDRTARTYDVRLDKRDIPALMQSIAPPSLGGRQLRKARRPSTELYGRPEGSSDKHGEEEGLQKAQQRIAQLERDNEKLAELLKRAQKTNAGLWERVVKDAADGPR